MDSSLTQTPREKLEAWLRYYDDLNLGAFYTDRRTMGKRTDRSERRQIQALRPQFCLPRTPVMPITPPPAAPKVSALPIVNAPSLFEAVDRVEGDTLERIREDLGECTRCRLHKQRNKIVFGAGNPRAELVFVGEGPATMKTCRAAVCGPRRKTSDADDRGDGAHARAGLHLQRGEMPAAGKSQA